MSRSAIPTSIAVIDPQKLAVIEEFPAGRDPERVDVSPDGKTLYVTNEDSNFLTFFDAASKARLGGVRVGVEPEGLAVSPDGKLVVATTETTNMAHFVDAATRKTLANVLVDSRPRMAAFTPDGSEVWVSAEIGGDVVVLDAATRKIKDRVKFEIPGLRSEKIQPVGVTMSRDGKLAFVSLGPANRVAVVDVKSRQTQKYLLVGQRVWHAALTPDQKFLVAANGVTNDVSVIDVAALKVVKSIQVGEAPWEVAIPGPPKP